MSSSTASTTMTNKARMEDLDGLLVQQRTRAGLLIVLISLGVCTTIAGITVFIIGTESQQEKYYSLSIIGPVILGLGLLMLILAKAGCIIHLFRRREVRKLEHDIIDEQMRKQIRAQEKERQQHERKIRQANLELQGFHNESFQTDLHHGYA